MKFVIVAVLMAIYLVDDVHSASVTHTISNDKLSIKGSVDANLSIPIEEVWDSLSQGEKNDDHFCRKNLDQPSKNIRL